MTVLTADHYPAFVAEVFGDDRSPFLWQEDLLAQVLTDRRWPDVIDIPTGLGKTSTIDMAVFTLAAGLSQGRDDAPTRTFFVIDRRIVVDSAFDHATKVADALAEPRGPVTTAAAQALRRRAGDGAIRPLEVVRMRGGVTWGWRWLRQPDQPAVVVGTVDQYGSRLLFRGYGVGPRLRPIDAALCGTDALVLVDEAHLCVPLLETVRAVNEYEAAAPETPLRDRRLQVVTLSATTNDTAGRRYELTSEMWRRHLEHPVAGPRLRTSKRAALVSFDPKRVKRRQQLADEMAEIARTLVAEGEARRVAVVANTVNAARHIYEQLDAGGDCDVRLLVGRVRPFERERIQEEVVALAGPDADAPGRPERPVVVVATQTIEVGADLGFDALVTEAAPLDALIQRFGRVARWGSPQMSQSVIVHAPALHAEADPLYGPATARTWQLLVDRALRAGATEAPVVLTGQDRLTVDRLERASLDLGAAALRTLRSEVTTDDYAAPRPEAPPVLATTLDAWSRTEPAPLPDQPVAPFLHGFQRPTDAVLVCWRADLDAAPQEEWCALVEDPAPRAHELVEVPRHELVSLLSGSRPDQDAADVPAAAPPPDPDGPVRAAVAHVVYEGRGRSRLCTASDGVDIPSGGIVVLPSSAGGHDDFGWTGLPGAPVVDVAELVSHPRHRPSVRLDPAVLGRHIPVPARLGVLAGLFGADGTEPYEVTETLAQLLEDLGRAVMVQAATVRSRTGTASDELADLVTDLARTLREAGGSLDEPEPAPTGPEEPPPGDGHTDEGTDDPQPPPVDPVLLVALGRVVQRLLSATVRDVRDLRLIDRLAPLDDAGGADRSRRPPRLLVRLAAPESDQDQGALDHHGGTAGTRQPSLSAAAPERRDLDDIDDCDDASTSFAGRRVKLADHGTAVGERAAEIAERLGLPPRLQEIVRLAGFAHDVGKADIRFQALLFGNRWEAEAAAEPIAKSGPDQRRRSGRRFGWPDGMRHEALSAAAVKAWAASPHFPADVDADLVVHLVGTHHGWGRPLSRPVVDDGFAAFEVGIPGTAADGIKVAEPGSHIDWDGPERFARLTSRYGRWGLALLEAVVRLADIACSEEGT